MRHIRTRRRLKFILTLLFVLCLILFLESRIEAFVPQIKNFAEIRVEETLGGRIKLSIGAIDGGILRPIVLNDIEMKDKKDATVFPSLVINSIKTNYRIWDVFFKNKDSSWISNFLASDSSIDTSFTTKNREVTGFVRLDGTLVDSKVKGSLVISDKNRLDFIGKIKDDSFDIEIRPAKGVIKAEGTLSDDGNLIVNLKLNHIKANGFDIVCDAILKNRVVGPADNPKNGYLKGELETQNLILNYRPFLNLKACYKISGGVLDITSLNLGESFKVYGKAVLRQPYNVDVTLVANNVSLSWLMLSLGAADATSILSGTMNGKFELKGPIKKAKLNARFEIRKGALSTLDFESLSANLKGELPVLKIEDSRITRESGYFVLAGEMDFRRFGKESMFNDVKLISDEKAILWDGFGSTKIQDVQEVRMTKKLSEDVSLDFKKFIAEQKVDESLRDTDEVRLEYKLHPHDSLKMMVGADNDFFGLEHKDKF